MWICSILMIFMSVGMDWTNAWEVACPSEPVKINGDYETVIVTSPRNKTTRDVILYWPNEKHVEMCRGQTCKYIVFYCHSTGINDSTVVYSNYTHWSHSTFVELSTEVGYNFIVHIGINNGKLLDTSRIYLPKEADVDKPDRPLTLTKRALGYATGVYEVSWTTNDDQSSPTFQRTDRYALYWCEVETSVPTQCNGQMFSTTVPKSKSTVTVAVQRNHKACQFAVSAISSEVMKKDHNNQYQLTAVSSGMVWETCDAHEQRVYGEMGPLTNRWVSVMGSTYMVLAWKLDCTDRDNVFKGYMIHYCPVNASFECVERIAYKFIDADQNRGVLDNLKPSTKYQVYMEVFTNMEIWHTSSYQTEHMFVTTLANDDFEFGLKNFYCYPHC